MNVGVSTACFFPLKLNKALLALGEAGVCFTECFFNTPSECRPPFLSELNQIAAAYGIRVGAVHPFTSDMESFFFFSQYEGRLHDGVELYHRYFEAAAQLGAPYVVFHGEHRTNQMEEQQAFEHIDILCRAARTHGVKLIHENVARCKGGEPSYLGRMHKALPELGFVLDCKQALRAGFSAMDFVRQLGAAIVHIHASDSTKERDCLPIGAGNFDFSALFDELKLQNAKFSTVVELYQDTVESSQMLQDCQEKLAKILRISTC